MSDNFASVYKLLRKKDAWIQAKFFTKQKRLTLRFTLICKKTFTLKVTVIYMSQATNVMNFSFTNRYITETRFQPTHKFTLADPVFAFIFMLSRHHHHTKYLGKYFSR